MIILNDKRLVLPEPGDVFKTVIRIGETPKLVLVRTEEVANDPDNAPGVFLKVFVLRTIQLILYVTGRIDTMVNLSKWFRSNARKYPSWKLNIL